jgi:hypothetical protein
MEGRNFSGLSRAWALGLVMLLAAACGAAPVEPVIQSTPTGQAPAQVPATAQPEPSATAEPSATSASTAVPSPTASPMPAATPVPSNTPAPSPTSVPPTAPPTATQPPPTATRVPPSPTRPPATNAPAPTAKPAAPVAKPAPSQQAFIAQLVPLAQAEQADSGVPASFSIALAAAETSWGISPLMQQYNNYHMVSCSKPNEGLPCVRYGNGLWNQYNSPEQAFLWHGRWMRANSGFAEAFKHTDDVATFTRLAATCYVNCSGPFPQRFYDALMKIIDDFQLRQYDAQQGKQ